MDLKRFAIAEMERAHRTLTATRELVSRDPDSAASRAYYAAFHMLSSHFAHEGCTFNKHTAIRAALHRELINTGRITTSVGAGFYIGLLRFPSNLSLQLSLRPAPIVRL